MRLATKAFMSTVSGLVLVMSYHGAGEATTVASAGTTTDDTTPSGTATPDATATSDDATGSTDSSASSDDGGDDATSDDAAPDDASTPAPSTSSSSSSSSSAKSSSSGTYTGDAVMTRWGVVQVEITVKNGKITKAEAVQYPSDNPRDQEINAYAVPTLNTEAVQAQSASIDAVSGATVTSDGYVQSLQSAIDQANL